MQRMERNAVKLAELKNGFYEELRSLIMETKGKYDACRSPEDLRLLENVIKTARDVFERREQKLVMKALRSVRTGDDDAKLVGHERKSFDELVSSIIRFRAEFDAIIASESAKLPPAPATSPQVFPKVEENGISETLVRVVKSIPKFVSSDMREYGPFEANAIVRIPAREAELLLSRHFAENM
ncbi:DNA replication complex GINS family protein [archaeon]|nr:DNA replication complex GINS family protein [archaeon]